MADNWIPVSNELPDEDGLYICWEEFYSANTNKPVFGYFESSSGKWETEIATDYSNVTHWMRLPLAPNICPLIGIRCKRNNEQVGDHLCHDCQGDE